MNIAEAERKIRAETDEQRAARPIFEHKVRDDGRPFFLRSTMKLQEAKLRSFQLPEIMNMSRLLTEKELNHVGWREAEDNVVIEVDIPGMKGYGYSGKMNLMSQPESSLTKRYVALRAKIHASGLQAEWQDFMGKHYLKKHKTCYEIGLSHQPTFGPSTLQSGRLARKDVKNCNEIHNEFLAICNDAKMQMFLSMHPDQHGRDDAWHQRASFTPGPKGNKSVTSGRINFSNPGELKEGAGQYADAHTDLGDVWEELSVLIPFSFFDLDCFPGRFNVLPLRLTSTIEPGIICFCSARLRHCSTGEGPYCVPRGDPRRVPAGPNDHLLVLPEGTKHQRIMGIGYQNGRWMDPIFDNLNSRLFANETRAMFEDPMDHAEWMVRIMIRFEDQIRYWGRKCTEDGSDDIGEPGNEEEGSGPRLSKKVSEMCLKILDAEIKRIKKINDNAKTAAESSGQAVTPPVVELENPDAGTRKKRKGTKKTKGSKKTKYTIVKRKKIHFPPVTKLSAEYYQKLFTFEDSDTGVTRAPDLKLIQRSLSLYGTKNKPFEKLLKAVKTLNCGARLAKRKAEDISGDGGGNAITDEVEKEGDDNAVTGKVERKGDDKTASSKVKKEDQIIWIYKDYVPPAFDPFTDKVPGNPGHKPPYRY